MYEIDPIKYYMKFISNLFGISVFFEIVDNFFFFLHKKLKLEYN